MHKSKTFTLTTRYGVDACGEAEVRINKEYAKKLLLRIGLLAENHRQDSDAIELCFWDGSPTYYGSGTYYVSGKKLDVVAAQCMVFDKGAKWGAYQNGEDTMMATEHVRIEDLKKIAEG